MAKKKGKLGQAASAKQQSNEKSIELLKRRLDDSEPEGTKRLNAEIPVSLHAELKKRAADQGRSMTKLLTEVLQWYLSH